MIRILKLMWTHMRRKKSTNHSSSIAFFISNTRLVNFTLKITKLSLNPQLRCEAWATRKFKCHENLLELSFADATASWDGSRPIGPRSRPRLRDARGALRRMILRISVNQCHREGTCSGLCVSRSVVIIRTRFREWNRRGRTTEQE